MFKGVRGREELARIARCWWVGRAGSKGGVVPGVHS